MTPDDENALRQRLQQIDRRLERSQRERETDASSWPVIIVAMAGAAIFAAGMVFGILFIRL